jgi:hypothetical protein
MPTRITQEAKDRLISMIPKTKVELCIKVMDISGKIGKNWWGYPTVIDKTVTLRLGLVDEKGVFLVIFDDITLSKESTVNIKSDDVHVRLEDFIRLL